MSLLHHHLIYSGMQYLVGWGYMLNYEAHVLAHMCAGLLWCIVGCLGDTASASGDRSGLAVTGSKLAQQTGVLLESIANLLLHHMFYLGLQGLRVRGHDILDHEANILALMGAETVCYVYRKIRLYVLDGIDPGS